MENRNPYTPPSSQADDSSARRGGAGEGELPSEVRTGKLRYGWSEDVWAIVLGSGILLVALASAILAGDAMFGLVGHPGSWQDVPWEAFAKPQAWLGSLVALAILISCAAVPLSGPSAVTARRLGITFAGLLSLGLLAALAFVMAGQQTVKQWGFEYVLWALLLGLIIRNTIGLPLWMGNVVRGELYVKWGLVLLGAEVLLGKLLALGVPGVMVSWVVTPIVLIVTFWFGCRILRIASPTLVIVVAADMSVCGVSAAIATAAACRAKKEELSLAIGLSMAFTAVMMVVMPLILRAAGVDPIVGGAWIGGTIDSTGAVAAAGLALGSQAETVAVTVKMIQNILIGVIAFAVSVYWAAKYQTSESASDTENAAAPGKSTSPRLSFVAEVWRRFPKFVLGFLAASIVASLIAASGSEGEAIVGTTVDAMTKQLRNWLFCFAFVCIGLQTHFATLLPVLSGGRTLVLYVVGQSFNILLTGAMATLVFGWLFRDAITGWLQ